MKDFFVRWIVRGQVMLLVVIVVCALPGGVRSAWAAKKAQVVVGFIGNPPTDPATGRVLFQNVLLNVQAVRINRHANAGPGSGGWQIIPTPPGIGGGNQNAELQIDLNTSQNVPQFFNAAHVQNNNYAVAQILLDTNNPGSLIPNCPQAPTAGSTADGCISYPMSITNSALITTPITGVSPTGTSIVPLVLQVNLSVGPAPLVVGGAYQVTLSLSQSTAAMGMITGPITVPASGGTKTGANGKLAKLAVAAETIGTNTVIASSQVQTSGCAPPFNNGACYTLMLPAAGTFGTLYDLAVAGGGDTYAAARLPPLYAGGQVIGPQNPPLKVTAATSLGSITGSVMDACTASTPIVGATLQLLVPPFTVMNPSPTFCLDTPQQCVSVASANTDNAGNFPLPGTVTVSPQFLNVPAAPSGNLNGAYAMEITAPGYDPLIVQAKPSNGRGGGKCALVGTNTFNSCKLSLSTAFISGTIPINTPLPGQPTLVQVFAEPTGTNDIQSSLPMPITVRNPNSSVDFTLKVPSQIPTFDLFATTIDLFQGVTDPFQGHDIVVLSGVKQPGLCQTNSTADFDPTQPITCVGHGTVLGQAFNANLGASVVLSKQDTSAPPGTFVQITNAQIQNQQGAAAPSPANSYAFCAPADTYQLQPAQLPQPQPGETPLMSPTAMPTGDAVIVTIPQPPFFHSPTGSLTPTATPSGPTPTATATPKVTCPTICSKPDGSCPGVCVPMNQPLTIPSLPPLLPTPTATATM